MQFIDCEGSRLIDQAINNDVPTIRFEIFCRRCDSFFLGCELIKVIVVQDAQFRRGWLVNTPPASEQFFGRFATRLEFH